MLKKIIKQTKSIFKKNKSTKNKIELNMNSSAEVVVYFAGNKKQLYQIEQWMHIFTELNKHHKICFIIKNHNVIEYFNSEKFKDFEVRYIKKLADLIEFYKQNNHKVVLYVNNSNHNFLSLINNRALHIHINHGESEKISSFSNQVKAYDYVFIVSDAAYNKYKLNLNKINMDKFIKVGRPQIEYTIPLKNFPSTNKKIVLYAPTWEGGYSDMNYSSIIKFDKQIISTLIENNYFIIYKPHPYVGSRDKQYKNAQKELIKQLQNYPDSYIMLEGDILSLYPYTDISIFDNSATVIDYLSMNKPYIITEFENNDSLKSMVLYGGEILTNKNISDLAQILDNEIKKDPKKNIRNKVKKYYLGDFDYSKKESTKTFINKIGEIIEERDKLISDLKKKKEEFNENISNILKEN